MKTLPQSPEPYSPPAELWYLAHKPKKTSEGSWNVSRQETSQMYAAMLCAIQPKPKNEKNVPIDSVTHSLVCECIVRHGENLMFVWQKLCAQKDNRTKSMTSLLTQCTKIEAEGEL